MHNRATMINSPGGHFESWGNKNLCFRTASLGQTLIQCEASRAKTKLLFLLAWDSTWPLCDKGLLQRKSNLLIQTNEHDRTKSHETLLHVYRNIILKTEVFCCLRWNNHRRKGDVYGKQKNQKNKKTKKKKQNKNKTNNKRKTKSACFLPCL